MLDKTQTTSTSNNASVNDNDSPPKNTLAVAIDTFIHAVKDTEEAARFYIPTAVEIHTRRISSVTKRFDEGFILLDSEEKQSQAVGTNHLLEANRKLNRLKNSRVPLTIEKSLFLNLFSDFDYFIGDLISSIFYKKSELFNSLCRQICVSEILTYNNFEELKQKVLSDEIECLRRKSYVDQFSEMESRFGVVLKKFDRWSQFVELTQRRNLLMHCNGIVSEQYIKICKAEGYQFIESINIGCKLEIGQEYFICAINLILEVAVKLTHTLWRKIFPDELEEADDHLTDIIYDLLHEEDWDKAICFGEYSLKLPKFSNDLRRKINIINLAIAYKMSGMISDSSRVLGTIDWSASINDFQLAHSVLSNDFDKAQNVMIQIGKKSTIIRESAYHTFPLFKEFRKSEQFKTGYESVYGYSFISELKRSVDDQKEEAVVSTVQGGVCNSVLNV